VQLAWQGVEFLYS